MGFAVTNGWDYMAYNGDPVYFNCDCSGEVVAIYNDDPNGEGIGVDIWTNDKDGLFQHRYWHLKSVACRLGKIGCGDLIGYADNTGKYTTGDHLHYDLKPLVIENGVYKNKFQGNGYYGCVDPTQYYTGIFVLDYVEQLKAQLSILQKLVELFIKLKSMLAKK